MNPTIRTLDQDPPTAGAGGGVAEYDSPPHGGPTGQSAPVAGSAGEQLDAAVRALRLPHRALFTLVDDCVVVRSNSAGLLGSITATWRPFATGAPHATVSRDYAIVDFQDAGVEPSPTSRFGVLVDGRYVLGTNYRDDAVGYLEWLGRSTALTSTPRYAVFHSAALAYQGRGLLLAAASGSGKTTLTAALVQAGFAYLSDEAALVDVATLRVRAYPQLLSIKRAATLIQLLALPPAIAERAPADAGAIWHLDAALLAPGCRRDEMAPAAVVFPHHDLSQPTSLVPLSRAAAALQLLGCGVNDLARPPRGIALATALLQGVACYSMIVNDLPVAVRLLSEALQAAGGSPMAGRVGENSRE
jgi:hypothetical protein